MDLTGTTAVVTGGGSGIGRGIVRACAAAGVRVAVADIDRASAEETADGVVGATALHVDVSDTASTDALAAEVQRRVGDVDVVFCNAGTILLRPVLESTADDWAHIIGVNLYGVVNTVRSFVPALMVRARPSHLVITASMASLRPPYTRSQALYTASKFAVLGFAEALVPEIEPHGIGLTVVFPGPVQTNLVAGAEHRRPGSVPHGVEALPLPEGLADLEIESIDGDEAGRRIVDAVRAGRRYFGTHPEMLAQVQLPQREIARGFAPLN